jgi:hypothetical protein
MSAVIDAKYLVLESIDLEEPRNMVEVNLPLRVKKFHLRHPIRYIYILENYMCEGDASGEFRVSGPTE